MICVILTSTFGTVYLPMEFTSSEKEMFSKEKNALSLKSSPYGKENFFNNPYIMKPPKLIYVKR